MWKYGSALQQRPELNPYSGRGATSHNWHAPKPHRKTGFRGFERGREGRVANKRTPLDTTRAAHVETTLLPSGHTNTVTTRTSERLPTPVHGYWGRQPHNGYGATPKGRGRGSERTDPYHHATRRGNDNDERARRRQTGTTETNDEGTASAAILGRRRDAAGTRLDDAEPRTKTTTATATLTKHRGRTRTARRRDERHDDWERREDDDDDDRGRRGGDEGQPAAAARMRGRRGTRRSDAHDGGGAARRRTGRPTGRRRRERTEATTMDRGGVWMEGKRCRGRPCRCDARGGDGDVGRRTGTAEGAAGVGADETEGEAARATAFRRNRGQAGVEGDAATLREEMAQPART
uniref:Pr1-like protein n=1 Tax=Oryza sativa subsp. japonica TaxID=39947 RepID=Q6K3B5_ORYSJ|nr:pr1-like protein [Oryza sativa Japonica Group]BAD22425.1 pr1-like protein [Oryza sativa Japonica Group]